MTAFYLAMFALPAAILVAAVVLSRNARLRRRPDRSSAPGRRT